MPPARLARACHCLRELSGLDQVAIRLRQCCARRTGHVPVSAAYSGSGMSRVRDGEERCARASTSLRGVLA